MMVVDFERVARRMRSGFGCAVVTSIMLLGLMIVFVYERDELTPQPELGFQASETAITGRRSLQSIKTETTGRENKRFRNPKAAGKIKAAIERFKFVAANPVQIMQPGLGTETVLGQDLQKEKLYIGCEDSANFSMKPSVPTIVKNRKITSLYKDSTSRVVPTKALGAAAELDLELAYNNSLLPVLQKFENLLWMENTCSRVGVSPSRAAAVVPRDAGKFTGFYTFPNSGTKLVEHTTQAATCVRLHHMFDESMQQYNSSEKALKIKQSSGITWMYAGQQPKGGVAYFYNPNENARCPLVGERPLVKSHAHGGMSLSHDSFSIPAEFKKSRFDRVVTTFRNPLDNLLARFHYESKWKDKSFDTSAWDKSFLDPEKRKVYKDFWRRMFVIYLNWHRKLLVAACTTQTPLLTVQYDLLLDPVLRKRETRRILDFSHLKYTDETLAGALEIVPVSWVPIQGTPADQNPMFPMYLQWYSLEDIAWVAAKLQEAMAVWDDDFKWRKFTAAAEWGLTPDGNIILNGPWWTH